MKTGEIHSIHNTSQTALKEISLIIYQVDKTYLKVLLGSICEFQISYLG